MALLDTLFNEGFLLESCWKNLNKSNEDSFGISGESISTFAHNLESRLSSISKDLKEGNYHFGPNRAAIIPKDNGKFRPLQIPEIADRIVLKGIAILLEEELAPILKKGDRVSFAYQKKLGVKAAILKMLELYKEGYTIILEADIENFFPSVDRKSLLDVIFKSLPDTSLNKLIEEGLNQKIEGLDKIKASERKLFSSNSTGIPQGNPLSPLFSNIFLADFDEQMKYAGFKVIRYADDFIVMCKDHNEAKRAYELAQKILEGQLKLKLHPLRSGLNSKTKIVNPTKDLFSFLSVTFDGKTIFPSRKSVDRYKQKIDNLCNGPNKTVFDILNGVKFSIDGWVSTYSYTDCKRYFREIDAYIDRQVFLAIRKFDWRFTNKVSGKLPSKFRKTGESSECLSKKQRSGSGIQYCHEIYSMRTQSTVTIKSPK